MAQNWKKYNQNLIKRGEIIFDTSLFQDKQEDKPKRGRPYKYPTHILHLRASFQLRAWNGRHSGRQDHIIANQQSQLLVSDSWQAELMIYQ